MNQKKLQIPDDEDNPFHTIGELLTVKKITVAVLADAIEKHGICTYDQYGRFGFADEEGKAKALHLLKIHHEWESIPPEERSCEDPRSPIDQRGCCGDNAYEHFGWTTEVVPDSVRTKRMQALGIEESETGSPINTKPSRHLNHDLDLQQNANDIAAELKSSRNKKPTKNQVAKILAKGVEGISVETIERRIRVEWK